MEKIKNLIKTTLEIGFVPEKEIEKINECAEDLSTEEYEEIKEDLIKVEELPTEKPVVEETKEEITEEEKENEDTLTRAERRAKAREVNRK